MPEICVKSGCLLKAAHDGFCLKHAAGAFLAQKRKKVAGTAAPGARVAFIKNALAAQTNACILFPFSTNSAGWLGRERVATRLACQLAHGTPQFDGMMAIHSCGNGHLWCVNPRHLSWGDAQDNGDDAAQHRATGKVAAEPMTREDVKNARRLSKNETSPRRRFGRDRKRVPIGGPRPEYEMIPTGVEAFRNRLG